MITVTILTKDNQETLKKTLDSVSSFSEVIVLDTGSKDNTEVIAKSYPNVRFFTSSFLGFGPLRNLLISFATHDWILSLDSDEVLSSSLLSEISSLKLDPQHVYSFSFKNYFRGKWIKGCGWYPDRHIRLFNKHKCHFDQALVHEGLICPDTQEKKCKGFIEHYSYRSFDDFLKKAQIYSTLFVEQNLGKKKSSFKTALFHAVFAFFKSYILKKGIFDGSEGFVISSYQAHVAFYKYLKLAEASEKCS